MASENRQNLIEKAEQKIIDAGFMVGLADCAIECKPTVNIWNFFEFLRIIFHGVYCFRWPGIKVEPHFLFCELPLVWIGLKEFELFTLVMIPLTKMPFWP